MKQLAEMIGGALLLFGWIAGIVIAKGFWSTLVACVIPLWAWYLFVEKILIATGLI